MTKRDPIQKTSSTQIELPFWRQLGWNLIVSYLLLGILPVLETTDQFRQFVATDVARSAELLKEAGFKPE